MEPLFFVTLRHINQGCPTIQAEIIPIVPDTGNAETGMEQKADPRNCLKDEKNFNDCCFHHTSVLCGTETKRS